MVADLSRVHHDSYQEKCLCLRSLLNSVRSYIKSKLESKKKTNEFLMELRQKLFIIHKFNSDFCKVFHKYPHLKKLQYLLVKYVELEFDIFYSNNPSKQFELITESRVLHLLQVMLYPIVLSKNNRNIEIRIKNAIIDLLKQLQSKYLEKNKFIFNILNTLQIENFKKETIDCIVLDCDNEKEIKETKAVVTFEILDDDEDGSPNYMVYLGKEVKSKTKEKQEIVICSDSDDEIEVIDSKTVENVNGNDHLMIVDENSEVGCSSDDLDCRINESLLEELLLDENALLQRKEFEKLEDFLFNDKTNFFVNDNDDDNQLILDTFDADINSLESLLDESYLMDLSLDFSENTR